MLPTSRSTALKILGGLALIVLSFWLTLQGLEHFQSEWEPIRSKIILTFGDSSVSEISLTKNTKFRYGGYGYVELQDTKGLECRKFKCNFSLAIAFAPIQANPQFIIGQSYQGEAGWHLMWGGVGRLVLQTEGGAIELSAPFNPKPGQRYSIEIARDEQEVKLSVDDVVATKSKAVPFTDLARDLTIGGRAGPVPHSFAGTITDVQIARQRPRP